MKDLDLSDLKVVNPDKTDSDVRDFTNYSIQ